MWIVAVAWIYVVVLMAATEPTAVGVVMTFVFYCALPLSILFYLTGAKRRRQRRQKAALQQHMGENTESKGDSSARARTHRGRRASGTSQAGFSQPATWTGSSSPASVSSAIAVRASTGESRK